MVVGTYVAGAPKTNGKWTPNGKEVLIDAGALYASKDFYDPVKQRRINWGWARVPPASTQTLPREVTWNPELQQLVFSPVDEQEQLRDGDPIGTIAANTALKAGTPVSLKLPAMKGNQSEIMVSFAMPKAAARLSVNVMVDKTGKGVEFFVDFAPAANWTSNGGVQTVTCGSGKTQQPLSLVAADKTVDIRLFVDNTFTEAFFMGGRRAMTIVTIANPTADVTVASDKDGVNVVSATAWAVKGIWVSPSEVLAMNRTDGGASDLMARRIEAQQLVDPTQRNLLQK